MGREGAWYGNLRHHFGTLVVLSCDVVGVGGGGGGVRVWKGGGGEVGAATPIHHFGRFLTQSQRGEVSDARI